MIRDTPVFAIPAILASPQHSAKVEAHSCELLKPDRVILTLFLESLKGLLKGTSQTVLAQGWDNALALRKHIKVLNKLRPIVKELMGQRWPV
jgi:hypothetical protein